MSLDFSGLIDLVLEVEMWAPRPREIGVYRASEYLRCPRSIYWSFHDPLPITDKKALRRMRAGTVTEAELIRMTLLRKDDLGFDVLGMQGKVDYSDKSGIVVRGRTDQVVRIVEDDQYAILEYKSTTSLEYSTERGWVPRPGDIGQLQLYLNMADVDLGYLVYVDRDDYGCRQYTVKRDMGKLEEILDWYRTIHMNVSERALPRLQKVEICESCQYAQRCDAL